MGKEDPPRPRVSPALLSEWPRPKDIPPSYPFSGQGKEKLEGQEGICWETSRGGCHVCWVNYPRPKAILLAAAEPLLTPGSCLGTWSSWATEMAASHVAE